MRTPALLVALLAVAPAAAAYPLVLQHEDTYVVNENGSTVVVRETNGKLDEGVRSYGTLTKRTTGAQLHDVCYGVYTKEDVAYYQRIHGISFEYVPWQVEGVGVGDEPGSWLHLWKTRYALDLTLVADLPAECAARGGAFVAADEIVQGPHPYNAGHDHDYDAH